MFNIHLSSRPNENETKPLENPILDQYDIINDFENFNEKLESVAILSHENRYEQENLDTIFEEDSEKKTISKSSEIQSNFSNIPLKEENSMSQISDFTFYLEKRNYIIGDVEKDFINQVLNKRDEYQKEGLFKKFPHKFGYEICEEQEEMDKIVKKLLDKNKEANLLTTLANQQKNKHLTIENLLQELFILKRKRNEDEALINMLKVQIRKIEKPDFNNEKNKEKKHNLTKNEEILREKEKLLEENNKLKTKITEENEKHRLELMKLNKLNHEISKNKGPAKKIDDKSSNGKKNKEEIEAVKASMRVEYRELEEKLEKVKEKLKEKEDKEIKLRIALEVKNQSKLLIIIENLKQQISKKEEEIKEIKNKMALDNQIKILFPRTFSLIENMLNVFLKVEENKAMNSFFTKINKIYDNFLNLTYRGYNGFMLLLTKDLNRDPNSKEIIQATLKQWNKTPSILRNQMDLYQNELKMLKKELEKSELESKNARIFIENMKNDRNFIEKVINEFPDVLIDQLLKNSSSQILCTATYEKNKEKINNTNFNSLDFLKIYTRLLETYKHLDSDMMVLSFLDSTKEGEDLDETVKIKKEFSPKEKANFKKKENIVKNTKNNEKAIILKNSNLKTLKTTIKK